MDSSSTWTRWELVVCSINEYLHLLSISTIYRYIDIKLISYRKISLLDISNIAQPYPALTLNTGWQLKVWSEIESYFWRRKMKVMNKIMVFLKSLFFLLSNKTFKGIEIDKFNQNISIFPRRLRFLRLIWPNSRLVKFCHNFIKFDIWKMIHGAFWREELKALITWNLDCWNASYITIMHVCL